MRCHAKHIPLKWARETGSRYPTNLERGGMVQFIVMKVYIPNLKSIPSVEAEISVTKVFFLDGWTR